MTESVSDTLQSFISDELLGGEAIHCDDNILSDGMIDSVGMMRLVAYIEERFDFSVSPKDFVVENFQSVRILSNYVLKRLDDVER